MKDGLLFLLVIPWTTMLRGLVLVKLWAWFMVPQFGVHPLTIPVALGIAAILYLLTMSMGNKGQAYTTMESVIISVVTSLMALGCGWIYRLFM